MSSYLIIDAENIRIHEEELIYLIIRYQIDVIFVYFDMEKNNIAQHYADWLFKYPCFLVHVPSIGGKNSVDLQISIDVTEWCVRKKEITTIVLASNDRDFFPLCQKMQSLHRRLCLVAQDKINDTLLEVVQCYECLSKIPIDLTILIHCFLLEHKMTLTIPQIKRMLKKINKKKKMLDYPQLCTHLTTDWKDIFDVDGIHVTLRYPLLEAPLLLNAVAVHDEDNDAEENEKIRKTPSQIMLARV
jgi:hypothetical protein